MTDILVFDKTWTLVSGTEERPSASDAEGRKNWDEKAERAKMQLRGAVDDAELSALVGLDAPGI